MLCRMHELVSGIINFELQVKKVTKKLSTTANQTNGVNKEIHDLAEFELHQKFETQKVLKQKIKKISNEIKGCRDE